MWEEGVVLFGSLQSLWWWMGRVEKWTDHYAAVRLVTQWDFWGRNPETDLGAWRKGRDQLSRGNCKCKDTDTQNIMASSGNHSGLILVECRLAGDWESEAGRQGPGPWGSCTGLRTLSCEQLSSSGFFILQLEWECILKMKRWPSCTQCFNIP